MRTARRIRVRPGLDAVDDPAPVLVVDDQAGNLEAVEVVLSQCGCRLVRAQSADEALLALLDQEFAAIVLDIKMPGMGGLELARDHQAPAAHAARADPVSHRAHDRRDGTCCADTARARWIT